MPDLTPTDVSPADSKANILLVDDRPANLLALEAILGDLGQNLVKAHSGEEALQLLTRQEFAVVLLDVQMPGLDGFETARRIRDRDASRHTPLIFITGYDDSGFPVIQAYSFGAVDYLVKPLVPVILRAKVAGFVELFEKSEQVKRQAEQLRQVERREFEEKLAEENVRLRESEARFRTLADSIPQLAWMARPDGYLVWYNKRWYDYTGTTPEQMEGWGWQAVHDPAELSRVMAKFKAAIASGEPWEDTFPLRRHDGAMRWHLSRALPVRDEHGQIVRWFGTNTDITERMQMEEALRQSDRLKDEFLAMLAHELRNPLGPIRNSLYIMKQPGANREMIDRVRDVAERQVSHMARLLDDLLDVSRISQGRIELRPEVVDMVSLVHRTVEAVRPFVEERRHELTLTLPSVPIQVRGDPTRLEQILTNLLNNAAKYTDPGGHIWLTVQEAGSDVVLRVRDDGIGIEPGMVPRIFDLFVQAERRLDRSKGGIGIGLTLVRKLVELHDGNIQATSPGLGQGSEFILRLPGWSQERARQEGERKANAPTEARLPSYRVLVVDDNTDAAESLGMFLTLEGQEVRVAHDGLAALTVAQDFLPQLVFLDIGMPGMDGYEVGRRLRQQPDLIKVVLVALTGWGQEVDRRRSVEAGFDYHFVKPVEPDALKKLLEVPKLIDRKIR